MAIGVQLLNLVADVKAESGHSSKVSVGIDKEDEIKTMLRRKQETLYLEYEWPHLRVTPTKALSAGSRYYDMPANLNFDRIIDVKCKYNGEPLRMTRGISLADYAAYDSDEDERYDPALKWDLTWTGSATQIEVWPIPASNNLKLMFKGLRPLRPLVSNDDVCDIDSTLLTLSVATELLARQKSHDAQIKLQQANLHLARIKGSLQGGSETIALGQGEGAPERYPSRIHVSG